LREENVQRQHGQDIKTRIEKTDYGDARESKGKEKEG
jgi:hypothetical protein